MSRPPPRPAVLLARYLAIAGYVLFVVCFLLAVPSRALRSPLFHPARCELGMARDDYVAGTYVADERTGSLTPVEPRAALLMGQLRGYYTTAPILEQSGEDTVGASMTFRDGAVLVNTSKSRARDSRRSFFGGSSQPSPFVHTLRLTLHQYRTASQTMKRWSRRAMRLSLVLLKDDVEGGTLMTGDNHEQVAENSERNVGAHVVASVVVRDRHLLDVYNEEEGGVPGKCRDCVDDTLFDAVLAAEHPGIPDGGAPYDVIDRRVESRVVRDSAASAKSSDGTETAVQTLAGLGFRHQDFCRLRPFEFEMTGAIHTYTYWVDVRGLASGVYAFRVENVRSTWANRWLHRLMRRPLHYRPLETYYSGHFYVFGSDSEARQHIERMHKAAARARSEENAKARLASHPLNTWSDSDGEEF